MLRKQKIIKGKLTCNKCKKKKGIACFNKHKRYKDGYRRTCRNCEKKQAKEYYKKYPEKRYSAQLKYHFGITMKDYNNMLKQQNNCCAICGRNKTKFKKRLAVDHNHKTKYIRGLLCMFCNSRLLRYLKDHKGNAVGLVCYLQKAIDNDTAWE